MNIKTRNIIFFISASILLTELIRTAFITDDAGITLRSVLNFVNGFGPTFNLNERVQAYTHPLWFFSLSFTTLILKNVFYATFFLSIALSILSLWLLINKLARSASGVVAGVLALILSKSYVDFSTSGLENPLSHVFILLSVLFAIQALFFNQKKFTILFFLSIAFLYLNRQDLILLVSPLALLVLVKNIEKPKPLMGALLIGAIPVVVWTIFSLYYYGFPFPNTAYAKLATGVAESALVTQGAYYFAESFIIDPLALLLIVLGIVVGGFSDWFGRCLSLGIALYLVYVLRIGGDFMSGRFFTAPLLLAVVQIARLQLSRPKAIALVSCVAILGAWNIKHTLLSDSKYVRMRYPVHGVDDVRGFYYQDQGLLTSFVGERARLMPALEWSLGEPRVEVTCGNMGFQSLYAGPSVHMIDVCALSDPLLARLPSIQGPWQIGHFVRSLPAGYTESVATDRNLIEDGEVRKLYDSIRLITRGSLNDWQRFSEIAQINLHALPKLNPKLFRYPINLDETIFFKANSKGVSFLQDGYSKGVPGNGWASSEPWGVWALGHVARLSLRIPTEDKPTKLTIRGQVLTSSTLPIQKVEVFDVVGGGLTAEGPVARYAGGTAQLVRIEEVTGDRIFDLKNVEIVIPLDKRPSTNGLDYINMEFRFPTPLRPMDLGEAHSEDSRELTFGLISAVFN